MLSKQFSCPCQIAELMQTNEALKKTKAGLEENNAIFQEEAKKAKDKIRALKSERIIEKSHFEEWWVKLPIHVQLLSL